MFSITCDKYEEKATSYIYQTLGDVEWYVEMKLSAWQQ